MCLWILLLGGLSAPATAEGLLDKSQLANQYFGAGSQWFVDNIPFLETSDPNIQQIFYYRWDVVKKNLLWLPAKQRWVMTEFSHDVSWDHPTDRTINAAAGHHISEARWLKTQTYDKDYIDYWFRGGGSIQQYSFWAASAVQEYYLSSGNKRFVSQYLPEMKANYDAWGATRYDPTKGFYWQNPLRDATEYSIAGIEEGNDPWYGGNGFRPTFNAYMFGDARAISAIAQISGDVATATDYAARAAAIKSKVQSELWNPSLQHFSDRLLGNYELIHSRELAGFVPWQFGLPDDSATFGTAWNQLIDTDGFLGSHGLRTVEGRSVHYLNPLYGGEAPQWNGPSWPYHTSMVLTGLANLLDDYSQHSMTKAEYVDLLRQYTLQQYKLGQPYIAEAAHPDQASWIIDIPNRSEDYFHSTYNDLIITGLAGLRPRNDDVIEINPLIDDSIGYLLLEDVPYHGLPLTILWDRDNHYGLGTGLRLYANGHELGYSPTLQRLLVDFPDAGDANVDGLIDVADLGLLASHWQSPGDWLDGDFNHDGFIDIDDLRLLIENWQPDAGLLLGPALASLGLPGASVPEPNSALYCTGTLLIIGLFRFRQSRILQGMY